jgi:hypothetical protein
MLIADRDSISIPQSALINEFALNPRHPSLSSARSIAVIYFPRCG